MEYNRLINAFRFNRFFWIAFGLLIAANVFFYFIFVTHQKDSVREVQNRYKLKRQTGTLEKSDHHHSLIKTKEMLAGFKAQLHPKAGFTEVVREFFDIMHKQGLSVEKMSYKPQSIDFKGLLKYSTSVTLTGNYPRLKAFLAGVQNSGQLFCIEKVSFVNRSSTRRRTGMLRSAHSMRSFPFSASLRSLMSHLTFFIQQYLDSS